MKERLLNSVYGKVRSGELVFLDTLTTTYLFGMCCHSKKVASTYDVCIDVFDVERKKHLYIGKSTVGLARVLNALFFSLLECGKDCKVTVSSFYKVSSFHVKEGNVLSRLDVDYVLGA